MKVAVIILNYNSSDDCRKCVSFLKRQEEVELELVLVDNCSLDRDKVETLCREQDCTFIASPENRGYNAGNNIGLRYAAEHGYEYALIANPDMEFPQSNYVKMLVEAMVKDENVAAIGSEIMGVDGDRQNPINFVSFWDEFLWPLSGFKHFLSKKSLNNTLNYEYSQYCPALSGCCLMVSIPFLQSIGFFDENVFLYCEEAIFAMQVQRLHKKLFFLKEATAVHFHIKQKKGSPYPRLLQLCKSRDYKNKYYSNYNEIQIKLLYISNKLRKWLLSHKI